MERGNSDFTVEELGIYHLNQEASVNIISHVDITYPLIGWDEKGTSPLAFLPPNPSLRVIMGKQDKPELRYIRQRLDGTLIRSVKVIKKRERPRIDHRLQDTKEK